MKISQNDIINFGVDYIEIIGVSEKIKGLSLKYTDNDRFNKDLGYVEYDTFPGFKIKKTNRVMNYEYKIIFRKNGIDCFAYHKGQNIGAVTTTDFFAVYGVAFKLFNNLSEIIDFVKDNLTVVKLRRFDLAIDIPFKVSYVHKNFKDLKQKGSKFYDENGKLQTFYIGEKRKSQNSYKLLRCYNKLDDIIRNKRQELYADYFLYDFVTRVELEFRSELCQKITLDNLLDKNFIFNTFLSYIKQYTDIFSKFKYDVTKLNVQKKRISIDELKSNRFLKNNYVNIFLGYGKTILKIGACPVDLLIRNNILSDDTKKDIVLSIKNGEFRQDIYEYGLNVRNTKHLFSDNNDDIIYISNQENDD